MTRLKQITVILLGLCVIGVFPPPVRGQDVPQLNVEKYELANGLDVILYEDHTLPKVSVNLLYNVGSKNERPGRTGFAHLFEHMMFQASEHHQAEYFEPLNKIGAQVNGGTTPDWTMYWEDVPSEYLELVFWLESDRMGFLLPALTQEMFDNQRDVVKNERRQSYENRPYAKSSLIMDALLYPSDHPYSWPTIGSQEDLSAATLDDVKEFFRLYYAPNNASLVVAGDFDPTSVRGLVEKYFGSIPPGPPIDRLMKWSPVIEKPREVVAEDDVTLPRIYYAWHSPAHYAPGDAELDLLSSILTGGKTSRLYKSLVYDQQIAQDVSASQNSQVLGSYYEITVTAREGHDLEDVQAALDKELARLLSEGIEQRELDLAREEWQAEFIRGLESTGGFFGLAGKLNFYNVFLGEPNRFEWDMSRYTGATVDGIMSVARQVLRPEGVAAVKIVPRGTHLATESDLDRSVMPGPGSASSFTPPVVQRETLDNGLQVMVVEDHGLPLVQVNLVVKSGWNADDLDAPGAATMAAAMLDEGTTTRSALELSDEARALAAQLSTGSSFDGSYVRLNVLKKNLAAAMNLMADVALNPTFPEDELERQRKDYVGRLTGAESSPDVRSRIALMKQIYGDRHPYGQLMWMPLRFGATYFGFGNKASISALTRERVADFYTRHYLPNNAALVFVGDITVAEAGKMAEQYFGSWKAAEVPGYTLPQVSPVTGNRIVLIDKPDAAQSVIVAGNLGISVLDGDYPAMRIVREVLGGGFQRLDMNLREDKGYTYGAGLSMWTDLEQGPMYVIAPVQTEVTDKALTEIVKELRGIDGARPITADEMLQGKNNILKAYPTLFESISLVAAQAEDIFLQRKPEDAWVQDMSAVEEVDLSKVNAVAQQRFDPDALAIVIVGDLKKIESGVRALGLGEILRVDASGNVVGSGTN